MALPISELKLIETPLMSLIRKLGHFRHQLTNSNQRETLYHNRFHNLKSDQRSFCDLLRRYRR